MRKRLCLLALLFSVSSVLFGQTRYLEFTSQTEAKFFFYLNGKQLNQKSTGHIRIPKLEDKKYHVRIVVDDPYAVALTRTMHPTDRKCQYSITFNPVRDRVYLKRIHLSADERSAAASTPPRFTGHDKAAAPELREEWKR